MRIATVPLLILLSVNLPAQSRNSVSLEPTTHLRKGVDAWPMISHPSTPAEESVNAILNRLNGHMAKSLKDCDENYREWAKQVDQPLAGKNFEEGDWERTITATMTGPRFLSLVATDSVFCGGAHPDDDTLAMVFDLTTGRPVNWMALIAQSANASAFSDFNSDGNTVGALIVPALRDLSITETVEDCKNAFQSHQPYQLWPDAKNGMLIAKPFDLPHVVAACADDLKLTPEKARKMGFSETLLNAISQAHRKLTEGLN